MDLVQKLIELDALRRLKAQYCFFLDTKDWDSWLALFAPEATMQWDSATSIGGRDPQTSEKYVGIAAIKTHVVDAILNPSSTVHQGHTPILDLLSETEAKGIWAMEGVVELRDQAQCLQSFGHYHETYRKIDGSWRITSLHLKRLPVTVKSNAA
jgi:SnoaL-like domain